MTTFFANFIPWIAFVWSISFAYFMDKIRSDILDNPSLLEDGEVILEFNGTDIDEEY